MRGSARHGPRVRPWCPRRSGEPRSCAASPGCRRGRAPSACQSPGPSRSRVRQPAHRERSRKPRAHPAPGPPSRPLRTQRARLAGTKLPVHSSGKLCPSGCVPVTDATFYGAGSLGSRSLEKRCEEMRGGSGAATGAEVRCCRPSGLCTEPARSPVPLQNSGCVLVEATYGNRSGISHTTAKKPGEQSSGVLRWRLPLFGSRVLNRSGLPSLGQ